MIVRSNPRRPAAGPARLAALAAALLLTVAGCQSNYVNERYGSRSGFGGDGINGTAVLGAMIQDAGHRVRSVASLSPKVEKADVIVWFPTDYKAPDPDVQLWLEEWLIYNDEAKTLVYVSPDYHAGELYWSTTMTRAPAEQQSEFLKKQRESQSMFANQRSVAPTTADASGWFSSDRRNARTRVKQLRGPWASGVDASKARLEHRGYLTPADTADVLLADGAGHPLASEIVYEPESWQTQAEDSRLVIVENGSFLLNASLVNHEHRKLAGRLVDRLGRPQRDVVFLESGSSPPVYDQDPSTSPPTGFGLFGLWPIGAVLAQLAALGLVMAAAAWPIFGTPRRSEQPALTDFGRHVQALGRLLAATRDRSYAYAQLRAYFQNDKD